MAHAKLSPSSAHRWTKCTASPGYEVRFPDVSSEAADEGTFAHGIAERCLREGRPSAASELGTKSDCGRFVVDAETASAIDEYLDVVRLYEDIAGAPAQIEQRVTLTQDIWGTADALLLSRDGRDLYVIDYKHGAGVFVSAQRNEQLKTYGAAALQTIGVAGRAVERVTLVICQPRCPADETTRECTVLRDEMDAWAKELTAVAARTQINPTFVAGDHCKFCRGKAECSALRQTSLTSAREAFDRTPIQPEALDDRRLGELLGAFSQVRDWMQAVEQHALRRAQSGKAVPGHKLVNKIGLRRWNEEPHAASVLRTAGLDPHTQKLVSPAQAEKALRKLGMSAKQAKAFVADLAHAPQTGVTLVSHSDRRPEISLPPFTSIPTNPNLNHG
jgi:hypothetical protein